SLKIDGDLEAQLAILDRGFVELYFGAIHPNERAPQLLLAVELDRGLESLAVIGLDLEVPDALLKFSPGGRSPLRSRRIQGARLATQIVVDAPLQAVPLLLELEFGDQLGALKVERHFEGQFPLFGRDVFGLHLGAIHADEGS